MRPAHASFSSQAIDVQAGASQAVVEQNEIPGMFRDRLLSVRSFDDAGMMIDADVVDGHQLEPVIDRMLSNESVDFLQLHNARRECFLARGGILRKTVAHLGLYSTSAPARIYFRETQS